MRKRVFVLLLVAFNLLIVNSYAEVKWDVVDESKLPPEGSKTTITISLDLIECAPEKLTEYGIKYPEVGSGTVEVDKEMRGKLSRLKKDKDIKILYSTKLTTYPDDKVIVDNRQPLEYLTLEEKDGTTLKKEIKLVGNFFEVKPTITKDGEIDVHQRFWVSKAVHRVSSDKRIPEELGYPAEDGNGSNSTMRLKDGETKILGGIAGDARTRTLTSVGFVTEQKRRSVIICIGADINCAQNAPN